jgi:ribosome production factor 1
LLVLDERSKVATGLVVSRLPAGPSAAFKMTSSELSADIAGHGVPTAHVPEVFLNGFGTRLGRRVGRLIASLFPREAQVEGRRLCTFHNQRDFIFFRQHRYIFAAGAGAGAGAGAAGAGAGTRVRLQELGPRFTLKLKYLLNGVADAKGGEYEWFHKRHLMETSRRKFNL